MTTSDVLLIVFSTIVIGGLYFLGSHSRRAQRKDTAKDHDQ